MGAQTPEHHQQVPHGHHTNDLKPVNPETKNAGNNSNSADLDRGIVSDDDDDDDGKTDVGAGLIEPGSKTEGKKKSRKRTKKKKAAALSLLPTIITQTTPPSVVVSKLFPSGYPLGELVAYESTLRTTDEEIRYNSRLWDDGFLEDYRQAAEIHRQTRQYAQKELIKPGATLLTIAEGIDNSVRDLCGHQGLETGDGLKAGLAFPTGLSLNNVAAHWTPNPGGKEVILSQSDVLKVDFGVHVNGRIVDSAFTVAFDPVYDELLTAVRDATNTGINHSGVDARIHEISAFIQEVMESHEVEIDGKVLPVRAIRNITGHNILRYQIHGGKQIPFVKTNSREKMEEGEIFAIETFGSTGKGWLHDDIGIYGYGRQNGVSDPHLHSTTAKKLLQTIDANFGSLVFCRRYLERLGVTKYHLGMKTLVDNGIVEAYAPLVDIKGSHSAQFEHTILIHAGGREVVSRGDDY